MAATSIARQPVVIVQPAFASFDDRLGCLPRDYAAAIIFFPNLEKIESDRNYLLF